MIGAIQEHFSIPEVTGAPIDLVDGQPLKFKEEFWSYELTRGPGGCLVKYELRLNNAISRLQTELFVIVQVGDTLRNKLWLNGHARSVENLRFDQCHSW